MTTTYHHGVRVVEINEGTLPIRTVSTAVIGLVATSDDADAGAFPLNIPVLITNIQTAIGKAGTTGTLKRTLQAISLQTNPVTIVVRVAEGDDEAEQTTNVIGTVTQSGQYTGVKALLNAQAKFGIKPRILGMPGLDTKAAANALAAVASQLRAFAYITAWGSQTKEEATAYRDDFGQREVMVIWPDFVSWDNVANSASSIPAVAYALGLRAKIDNDIGWHKSLSNVVVNGPTGISRDVFWDLQSNATDAGYLNQAAVTTLINKSGFRFWGSRTAEDGGYFYFETATRTAQVLADTIADVHFSYVDKPMHPSLVRDLIESINAKFRELKTAGYLIDAKAWFDPAANTKEQLANGQLHIDYDYTPIPPLEDLVLQQRITDRYLADFQQRITA
ncbi:phage tail sheath protein [Undibacterium danionis]|uniref:Phage tail sheath protein n=1 Tax=Undibacterium danionis TaxID=1812100 RepID=A0ABV6IJ15_9BURK